MKAGIVARWVFAVVLVGLLSGLGAYVWRAAEARHGLVRAYQLAAEHRWTPLVDELRAYLRWYPGDEDAIVLLARAYGQLGSHDLSAEWWDRVPEESPRKASALLYQGIALLASHHASKAKQAWRVCMAKAEAESDMATANRAVAEYVKLCWAQSRKDEIRFLAARWADRSYGQGDLTEHLKALTWQLRLRLLEMAPEQGIEQLRRFVEADADDLHSRSGIARLLVALGQYDEARMHLRKCLAQDPEDLQNWETLLELLLDSGEDATAMQLLERFPSRANETASFLLLRARCAEASSDAAAAERWLRQALVKRPRDEQIRSYLASVLRQTGRMDQIQEQLAVIEELTHDRIELQKHYARLQESWEPIAQESESIGQACESLGYDQEALGWYRRAVALSPAATASKVAIERLDRLTLPESVGTTSSLLGPTDIQKLLTIKLEPERAAAPTASATPAVEPYFIDVAARAGIHFSYFRGETGLFWIVEPNGGSAGWLDADQDGWLDLFLVNGCQLPRATDRVARPERSPSSVLLRNDCDGTFSDVTSPAGLQNPLYGQGCAVADFDNDGFPDLFVTCYGANVLYQNCGDGTFRDVTSAAEVRATAFSTGAAFVDLNRDGIVDLYVVTYVDFDPKIHGKPCRHAASGQPEYCGPRCCPGTPDLLYLGRGDGTFEDVSSETGIGLVARSGFAVLAADLNNDGWPDLYVANDGQPNDLLLNESQGDAAGRILLRSAGLEQGCALDGDGVAQGSMGIACGDVDGDGLLDLGVSNFYHEHYTLYRNRGSAGFQDASVAYRLASPTRAAMGWGTGCLDVDADGWLDLFVVNGQINDQRRTGVPYEMTAQLFRNFGGRTFLDISAHGGPYFRDPHVARGTAVGDFDNDGRQDIAVVHHHAAAALLANRTETAHHILVLELTGMKSNRDATNTRAVVALDRAGHDARDHVLIREAVAGEGYLGSNDKQLWFGMGERERVDQLVVRWPSGQVDTFRDLAADSAYRLIEGREPRLVREYSRPFGSRN